MSENFGPDFREDPSPNRDDESAGIGDAGRLPDELPPVEPPSAGFIVQLFLVPGLIVLAVVGVWALFGKLASGEQDWRVLVAEVRSENQHRRWRGALGLAQMLKADQELGSEGRQLARNPQVADELAGLLEEQLEKRSQRDDDLKQQAFLARTLGFLDVPATVVPVLQEAMSPDHDVDVRRNAIASIALIAGRAADEGERLEFPRLVDDLISVSGDPEPSVKQLGAYTLGLMPTEAARHRLAVLVQNEREDTHTRANAAVGLARQNSTAGLPFFKDVLSGAADRQESRSANFEEFVTVKNTVKAIGRLSDELTPQERSELVPLIQPIAEDYREPRIRLDAQEVLRELK